MEIIKDEKSGLEIVFFTNDNGTTLSMLASTYKAQQMEHLTEIMPDDNKL